MGNRSNFAISFCLTFIVLCFIGCFRVVEAQRAFQAYGWNNFFVSSQTQQQNAANTVGGSPAYSDTQLAGGLYSRSGYTISKIRVMASAVAGTLGSGDLYCSIHTDTNGSPGTQVAVSNTITGGPPAGGSTNVGIEFTGFTYAISAYTQYWVVLRNANATPASNNVTWRYYIAVAPLGYVTNMVRTMTNGSVWNGVANSSLSYRIETDGGVFYGATPWDNVLTSPTSSTSITRVNLARSVGATFTAPPNSKFNVHSCLFYIGKTGAVTSPVVCKIYTVNDAGTSLTLVATSNSLPPAMFDTGATRLADFKFTTPYTLTAGQKYLAAMEQTDTASGSSSIYWASPPVVVNSNSVSLLPFNGTLRGAYCASSCGTYANWTFNNLTELQMFSLGLDPSSEFGAQGGSSGSAYFN